VAAQHLLVAYKGAASAPKGVTRTKEEARKRAEQAARRSKDGEDFSTLVGEFSDDATKADRGNVGMFTREKMVKPFSDAAFALRVGEVSDVVETRFGFHVIKRNQ
jgi:parvulin-like peptidyl-prolyl isomerase